MSRPLSLNGYTGTVHNNAALSQAVWPISRTRSAWERALSYRGGVTANNRSCTRLVFGEAYTRPRGHDSDRAFGQVELNNPARKVETGPLQSIYGGEGWNPHHFITFNRNAPHYDCRIQKSFATDFPRKFRLTPTNELFCLICESVVTCDRKSVVDNHRKSRRHQQQMISKKL